MSVLEPMEVIAYDTICAAFALMIVVHPEEGAETERISTAPTPIQGAYSKRTWLRWGRGGRGREKGAGGFYFKVR